MKINSTMCAVQFNKNRQQPAISPYIQPAKLKETLEKDTFQKIAFGSENLSSEEKIEIFKAGLTDLVNQKQANPENVGTLVKKLIPNIEVRPISELEHREKNIGGKYKYCALLKADYDDNLEIQGLQMFLSDIDYDDEKSVFKFFETTVHEFTHGTQHLKEDKYQDLKKHVNSKRQFEVACTLAESIISIFQDSYINQSVHSVADTQDLRDIRKYQMTFPTKETPPATEINLLRSCKYNNYGVFKKELYGQYDYVYQSMLDKFKREGLFEELPHKDSPNKLSRFIFNLFVREFSDEAQAQKKGAQALKEFVGMEKPSVSDYSAGIYSLLEKAFNGRYS